jgi:hypothetical protein
VLFPATTPRRVARTVGNRHAIISALHVLTAPTRRALSPTQAVMDIGPRQCRAALSRMQPKALFITFLFSENIYSFKFLGNSFDL